jgi:hypothetical protein
VYLFVGLAWFHSVREPPLYMAALAFTAYGVHWWAIGMGRAFGANPTPNALMCIAFTIISVLGIVVFFHVGDEPVGGLFIGLTGVYLSEFWASLRGLPEREISRGWAKTPRFARMTELGERSLGFFHLGTGLFLMYLTFASALNFAAGYSLPL